jgi:hypothetical protein
MHTSDNDQFDPTEQVEDKSTIDDFGDEPVENTEAPTTEVVKEDSSTENESQEDTSLTPPNNVRCSYNVNLSVTPYRVAKNTKQNSILLVPKRLAHLQDNQAGWSVEPRDADNPVITEHMEKYLFGLQAQHGGGFIRENGKNLGYFTHALDKEGSLWEQGILSDDGKSVYIRRANNKTSKEPRALSGAAARDRNKRAFGLGTSIRIPLVHSGIHVSMGSRSSKDFITLEAQIAHDKSRGGRDTIGIIYQNSQINIIRRVWDFTYESIRDVNVQNWSDIDLGDIFPCTELPILYWGLGCTMFPDGYNLDMPCSAGVNICKHVETVLLDLDKLLWINTNGLAQSQKDRLFNPGHQNSLEDLKKYQENAVSPFTRTFEAKPGVDITLKVPTINEYLEAGETWMADLTQGITELFGREPEDEIEVQAYTNRILSSGTVREYSHWVKQITYDKVDIVAGKADISENLQDMSTAEPEIIEYILEQIQLFIEDATVGIIAIPNYACPKCETDYVTDEHSKHPELVPIDMLKHLFTLKDLRLTTLAQA